MSGFFQYQSFDDAPGMVNSKAKLAAFSFPPLQGKSFFDVACNEGYYCGVALKEGASRVVGLDESTPFIEAARKRFPDAEFLRQSWDTLPNEKFDVILFASAIHYLSSKEAMQSLLARIGQRLTLNGVLILETGVAPGTDLELLTVIREDASLVHYPQNLAMVQMIRNSGLIERYVGQSEPGDGISRHVWHCFPRRPTVLILQGAPNSGKTRMGLGLSGNDESRILNVDSELLTMSVGEIPEIVSQYKNNMHNFNGIDHFFLTDPRNAAHRIASNLAGKTAAMAKEKDTDTWSKNTVIIDGFDISRHQHQQVHSALTKRLQADGFIVWNAQRDSDANS